MEEVSFPWVLYTISQGSYFLPVLNTFIFKDEKQFCEYTIQSNTLTRRICFESTPTALFIQNLLAKLSIQNKLRRLSEKICCVSTKNSKTFFNYKELKDLSTNTLALLKITAIQLTKANYFKELRNFVFKLTCSSGVYESSFFEKKSEVQGQCKDRNFYEKAKDVVNLILAYLKSLKNKKVVSLTVEFVSDDTFSIWVLDVPECVLVNYAEPEVLNLENLIEFESLSIKKNLSADLTFKGKIVAISSPDLSIPSPRELSDDSDKDEPNELYGFNRRNSTIKKDFKSRKKVETEDNDKFTDFLEILSKTYAKFGAETSGKRVTQEDVDKEYKRIAGLLTPETVEVPRKYSQISMNPSSQPNSPSMFRNRSGNGLNNSANNSRKGSEVYVSKQPAYRIRILKTIKD